MYMGLRLISTEDGKVLLYFHAPQHVTAYALLKYNISNCMTKIFHTATALNNMLIVHHFIT